MSRLKPSLIVAAVFSILFGLGNLHAFAASGTTISPAFQEFDVLPSQTTNSQSFSISNNDNVTITYNLSAVDMGALDDTGGIVFSGLKTDFTQKYGLAKWINLPASEVTVAAHATQAVDFEILNDDSLRPGGHYGAIIIKAITDTTEQAKNSVQLDPQAASLILVKKIGGDVYDLKLNPPKTNTVYAGLPSSLDLSFHNAGNVHVVPRGTVIIKNPSGLVVSKGIINPDSSLILPDHNRTFKVAMSDYKKLVWPGKYSIEYTYRYDGQNTTTTLKQNMRVYNLPLVFETIFSLAIFTVIALFIFRNYSLEIQVLAKNLLRLAGDLIIWVLVGLIRLWRKFVKSLSNP